MAVDQERPRLVLSLVELPSWSASQKIPLLRLTRPELKANCEIELPDALFRPVAVMSGVAEPDASTVPGMPLLSVKNCQSIEPENALDRLPQNRTEETLAGLTSEKPFARRRYEMLLPVLIAIVLGLPPSKTVC